LIGARAVQLPATVTLAEATALVRAAEEAVAGGSGELAVDASALANFDTSLVAVLLHARRLAQAAGRSFRLVAAPEKLAQLARLYGVAELLGLPGPASSGNGGSA
jgi:phospholipid transport system transporter-binding protein